MSWKLNPEDRTRLGSLLAARAVTKASDAEAAREKKRHPHLIEQLENDAAWSRELASLFLNDEAMEG